MKLQPAVDKWPPKRARSAKRPAPDDATNNALDENLAETKHERQRQRQAKDTMEARVSSELQQTMDTGIRRHEGLAAYYGGVKPL